MTSQLFPIDPSEYGHNDDFVAWDSLPHDDKGPMLIGVSIAFISLSSVFVVIRLWTRVFFTKRLYLEDYLIGVGWILAVLSVVFCVLAAKDGLGKHYWDLPWDYYLKPQNLWGFVNSIIYWVGVMTVKVAILLLYLRLSPSLTFRNAVYLSIFLIVASAVAVGIPSAIPCLPLRANWDLAYREVVKATCLNYILLMKVQSGVHVAGDLLCLLLPGPILWRSTMKRRKKLLVMAILSLGGIVSIVSIIRLKVVIDRHRTQSLLDYNYHAAELLAYSSVELNVGIICACLPATKQFFRKVKILPSIFGSSSSRLEQGSDRNKGEGMGKVKEKGLGVGLGESGSTEALGYAGSR